MKKTFTKTIISSIFILTIFVSCASTNKTVIESDSYEGTVIDKPIDNSTTKKTQQTKKKFSEKKGYEKNTLEKMVTFGNKDDFILIDQTSIFSLALLTGITQQTCEVLVNVKDTNEAGFGATIMSNYYIFMIDKENRDKLRRAYEYYLLDFEGKKLNRKNNKSFKQYGSIEVNAHWGTLKKSTPNFGKAKVNLGYDFEKNSPYFCLDMFPIHNDYYEIAGDAAARESMKVKYFFTKSQMRDLLDALSEDNISEILNEYFNSKMIKTAEADEYDSYSEE